MFVFEKGGGVVAGGHLFHRVVEGRFFPRGIGFFPIKVLSGGAIGSHVTDRVSNEESARHFGVVNQKIRGIGGKPSLLARPRFFFRFGRGGFSWQFQGTRNSEFLRDPCPCNFLGYASSACGSRKSTKPCGILESKWVRGEYLAKRPGNQWSSGDFSV